MTFIGITVSGFEPSMVSQRKPKALPQRTRGTRGTGGNRAGRVKALGIQTSGARERRRLRCRKRNRPPRRAIVKTELSSFLSLRFPVLQHFQRLIELIIGQILELVFFFVAGFFAGSCRLVFVG